MVGRRLLALLLLLSTPHGATAEDDGTIKIPIQVDQQGKQIYFVVHKDSDVTLEALRFCKAHLPTVDRNECISHLMQQVATVRDLRQEAIDKLPGMRFTVNDPSGKAQEFVHSEGADPREESRSFCQEHFPQANEGECIEAMLSNAARALDDINAREERSGRIETRPLSGRLKGDL